MYTPLYGVRSRAGLARCAAAAASRLRVGLQRRRKSVIGARILRRELGGARGLSIGGRRFGPGQAGSAAGAGSGEKGWPTMGSPRG